MAAFVTLISLPSLTAAIVKGALEAEGITVVLDRPALASIYAFEGGTWATDVRVPEGQLDRARQVLAEIEAEEV